MYFHDLNAFRLRWKNKSHKYTLKQEPEPKCKFKYIFEHLFGAVSDTETTHNSCI